MSDSKPKLFNELQGLATEARNPRTAAIDVADTARILELMNDEDRTVADVVRGAIPDIALVADLVAQSFRGGGRLVYAGAGTSGRLGVIDAAECPPTFGVDPDMVLGLIAGGRDAVFTSKEGSEDLVDDGARDVAACHVGSSDTVVGIAASRRTPYVLGALAEARRLGAHTAFVRCNDGPAPDVDVVVTAVTGPEAITGSTRLKAGTAQKMILNMITTASMVRIGKVYENLMVDLKPNSNKLVERGKGIVMMLTDLDYNAAAALYAAADRNVKTAVVMGRLQVSREEAERRLDEANGIMAHALGER